MVGGGVRRVGVRHLGTGRVARGVVQVVDSGRFVLQRRRRLEVYRREGFLALGAVQPVAVVELPGAACGAVVPGGGFVLGGEFRVWCVAADGAVRWELSGGGRVRGDVSVSPDGSVAAVVKSAVDGGDGPDELLILDTATGGVVGRQELDVPVMLTAHHVWHPDGSRLAVSCWDFWDSWITYWVTSGGEVLGRVTLEEAAGFVPGSTRLLTVRRAEGFGAEADELAVYDGDTGGRLAGYEVGGLLGGWADPSRTQPYLLDAERLVLSVGARDGVTGRRGEHWLCEVETLRPLGLLDYPEEVGGGDVVVPLGDGSWLTRRGRRIDRWTLG